MTDTMTSQNIDHSSWDTILGAQAKTLYSQMPPSRKPFRIGHMFI